MNAPPAALLDARYRLGAVIARGGMSTVYRGVDTRLDRPVAIKIMDAQLAADPAFRMRFEREARSAARIDHPAVVDVHDQGEVAGFDGPVIFLVMELVEGGTLRDVLRARGAVGVPAAFAVLEPVLGGLAEAHRLGLVHRDVKPENVLISGAGEVKVADFGLVTASAQAGASHVGMIMGTVAYLSPEQVETGAADARSDVYAAGTVLYELLVGQPPFVGDTAISVAYRHVNSDVPAPSEIAGDVPPELDELVRRATRRDPAGRPADAGALLAELRRVAAQLEVPAVPVPVPPAQMLSEPATVPAGPGPAPAASLPHHGGRPGVDPASGSPGAGRLRSHPAADGGWPGHGAAGVGPGGTRTLARPPVDAAGPAGPPAYPQSRRRSRRVFATWVALVLALTVLIGTAAWWLGAGRWTEMPAVVGLPEASAQQLLLQAGLTGTSTTVEADGSPAGVVAAADQPPGARLSRGTAVILSISAGLPTVPAIAAGTAADEAERRITAAGFEPDTDSGDAEFSDSVPEDTVIRTEPGAGTPLARGSRVALVLSRGGDDGSDDSAQVRVPSVINDDFDDARDRLEQLGLEVERQSQGGFGDRIPDRLRDRLRGNRVVQQSHGAGSMVDRGTTITLYTL
ncbi:MAG TPA: Stk1 family PASTA domain-containing Ser/Thr kinase [Pseudonocardia sp.]|nr:Stk1 family PASTA domain-containing Ser/Thr kinase [Pseudonocardia sp.]